MVNLARNYNNGKLLSARDLAGNCKVSYPLTCKLLQKLHKAELVKSVMGPKGGFILKKEPSQITLMNIVEILQGGIRLNRCLSNDQGCEFQSDCEISTKLSCLQLYIEGYLGNVTLAEVMQNKNETAQKV